MVIILWANKINHGTTHSSKFPLACILSLYQPNSICSPAPPTNMNTLCIAEQSTNIFQMHGQFLKSLFVLRRFSVTAFTLVECILSGSGANEHRLAALNESTCMEQKPFHSKHLIERLVNSNQKHLMVEAKAIELNLTKLATPPFQRYL